MRTPLRLLALAVALVGLPALAQNNSSTYVAKTFTQTLTGAEPTLETDGVSLDGVEGWAVTISAPSGQTLTGGGAGCRYYGPVSSTGIWGAAPTRRWMNCNSALNVTATTGVRDSPSLNFVSYVRGGRIAYVANAVTLSGAGTTVDITIEVRRRN